MIAVIGRGEQRIESVGVQVAEANLRSGALQTGEHAITDRGDIGVVERVAEDHERARHRNVRHRPFDAGREGIAFVDGRPVDSVQPEPVRSGPQPATHRSARVIVRRPLSFTSRT